MKKLLKKMLSLVSVAFMVQAIFAQMPNSNTKIVTKDLITDEIVDNLDTGAEGQKSLFFGGYDSTNKLIQAGYGQGFGDALWFSLYDGYYLYGNTSNTDSATSDSVARDGVNIDYTDNSNKATIKGYNNLKNNLAFSMYINKKIGGTFFWNTDTIWDNYYDNTDPTGALLGTTNTTSTLITTTTSSSTESTSNGTKTNTIYNALNNKFAKNTFGLNFNGVSTPNLFGDLNFYVALNAISVEIDNHYINVGYDKTSTLNGFKTPTGTASYTGTYNLNKITPALEFETGITGKKLWNVVTPSFILIENFQMTFRKYENSYNYNQLTTNTVTVQETRNTNYELNPGKYKDWKNTLTPRADFSFDLGERITLKTRAQAEVSFGNVYTAADRTTTTITTTTENKITGDTSIIKQVTTTGSATNKDEFTTKVTPKFDVGLVYQVVPGKFNVNIGMGTKSGVLTWTKTTTTNSNIPRIDTTTTTNYAGEEVTYSTITVGNGDGPAAGDATAETKVTNFTSSTPSVNAAIGFTLFLGEHAQLDTILLTSTGWQLNVNLGLRF